MTTVVKCQYNSRVNLIDTGYPKTFLDLGSGCGGSTLGLKWAGFEVIGIDSDPMQMEIYRANGGTGELGDYSQIDPTKYKGVEGLHTSFPCQGHSRIRSKYLPVREDKDLAVKCLNWIQTLRPKFVTSENVPEFVGSESYRALTNELNIQGYGWADAIVDCADYGLPQNRKRWFLWAVKSQFAPSLLPPANFQKQSWYGAIKHLIDEMPESELNAKQFESVLGSPAMISGQNLYGGKYTSRNAAEPSFCLTAFIHKAMPKLLIECHYPSQRMPIVRAENRACWTLRSASCSRKTSAQLVAEGSVRRLSIKALATLQGFPPDYKWSGKTAIDGHGIGNSVPPTFMKILGETLRNCR